LNKRKSGFTSINKHVKENKLDETVRTNIKEGYIASKGIMYNQWAKLGYKFGMGTYKEIRPFPNQ